MDSKKESIKIKVTPAYMRKCIGFVIETTTEPESRKELFNLLNEFNESDIYHIYGLMHSDTDWSRPVLVYDRPNIIVNRFGWFITKDKMKFPKGRDFIGLHSFQNVVYYIHYNDDSISESSYPESTVLIDDIESVMSKIYI